MLPLFELSRLYPQFLNNEHYLGALQRHFLPPNFALDQLPLSQFLSVHLLTCQTNARTSSPSLSAQTYVSSSPNAYPPTQSVASKPPATDAKVTVPRISPSKSLVDIYPLCPPRGKMP